LDAFFYLNSSWQFDLEKKHKNKEMSKLVFVNVFKPYKANTYKEPDKVYCLGKKKWILPQHEAQANGEWHNMGISKMKNCVYDDPKTIKRVKCSDKWVIQKCC
jgi:hypothetical protein